MNVLQASNCIKISWKFLTKWECYDYLLVVYAGMLHSVFAGNNNNNNNTVFNQFGRIYLLGGR